MNEQNDQNKDNMLDDRQQVVPAENEDNTLYTMPDVYRAQSSQDIYQVPETTPEPYNTGGVFSGEQPAYYAYDNAQYNRNTYDGNIGYGNNQYTQRQYGSGQYDYNQYGGGRYGGNQYGNNLNDNSRYGGNQYGNNLNDNGRYDGNQYNNNPIDNGQYSGNQYNNNLNSNSQYSGNQYGKNPNENGQYNGNQYGNGQFGNSQYGNNQYSAPYGSDQYYNNNPYSPYAVPPKKKHTGLIIGVIITVAILFLIALFALIYHALEIVADKKEEVYKEIQNNYDNDHDDRDSYHDYEHDDNRDNDHNDNWDNDHNDNHDYDHNDDYDYDYDDDYDYDSDEYYTLHDDIKKLSYSIDWEYFEYDTDDENVFIMVDYPVIVGDHIPNLDKINEAIAEEVSVFTEYYEDEYSDYMFDDDSYFNAYAAGYVTYMSEDILSVVFSEYVYTDYYDSVYLYCINIDVQDGVILDNTDIISVDDDFSVDFRYRSDEQNGSIRALDSMSDQEITELLTSFDSLIIFYTPQGMEIGVNYSDGWVTVTYHDYKDYLKIF